MTEIIDLFGRNKELETLSTTLVTITDMEDTDTDVVPEIVEIIKQLLDIIKTQQQSIENLACIAEKTIQLVKNEQKRLDVLMSIEDVSEYEKITREGTLCKF